ncbi:MAG: DUF6240 domain-containing protein, partial [Clostridiales bacterium]|nr:DUF6240 domain-containing protein [Clostridiales bacterium]
PYADGAPRTMGGEFSDASEDIDFESMRGQITDIIEDAGLTADDAVMADSEWLISQHIPLTGDNIKYLEQLRDLSYSLKDGSYDWDELIDSMSKAISGGHRPQDAYMITARRKLEETRLAMTTEASRSMLKQGIEIDTKPLEALVESLKAQERMYYGGMFGNRGIGANYGNLEAFSRATEVFEDLKKQPACVLAQSHMDNTVEEIYEAGRQLQAAFEEADEKYEELQTAPRADMGDAIQKAFRNVDDILTDLDLDTTDANRRAVRILAYNQTALSEENIVKVKAMDEEMQRAFKNMTPAVTLGMIRKGINPLDLTVEELNDAAEQVRSEIGHDEQERFSKYLYKLEQNHEITEQERESYIGIYRLITQVERTDGAAIGSLMNQGSQLTMRNLLTAMRSTKKAGTMDYKVDDNFEGAESTAKGPRIDEQIEAGFQQNCIKDILDNITPAKIANLADTWEEMTPEQLAEALKNMEAAEEEQQAETEYAKTQLAEYREVLQSSSDVYAYLERYDISNSMANILAASTMLRKPNQMMDRLWREDGLSESSAELISQMKEKVMEELGESLKNPEELADAMEDLADVAEHVMDTMIVEDPSVRRLDVRELRQMAAQFTMCGQMAHEECYMLPIQTGNSVTGVTLKVVRGKEEKGLVDILFESHHMGKVAASFKASENGISGMIATDDEETRRLLAANLYDIGGRMQSDPENPEAVDLKVAHVPDLSLQHYAMSSIRQEEKMKNMGQLAEDRDNKVQTTRLYSIAEGFIQTIKQLID